MRTPLPWVWTHYNLYAKVHADELQASVDAKTFDCYHEPIICTDGGHYGPNEDDRLYIVEACNNYEAVCAERDNALQAVAESDLSWAEMKVERDRLKAALVDANATFGIVEVIPQEDPAYAADVRALGDRIGYGALMTSAQAAWRDILIKKHGMKGGGEFVAGPCYSTVTSTLATIRQALSPTQEAGDE